MAFEVADPAEPLAVLADPGVQLARLPVGRDPDRLRGVGPAYVDGRGLDIAETAGARLVNRDRMWHYTEGLHNWDPIWAAVQAAGVPISFHVGGGDIGLSTGGRLTADDAGAILGGARPASGEEFVLLLRALGVRAGVDRWVDSWARVSGSVAGRQQQPGGVRLRLRRMVHALMVVGLS